MCLFALAFLYLCVSCVCSALSPGTSAMPPLSQFLTSLLKNMLIQTNLLFLLCSSHPPQSSWDGLEETYVHHPQPWCLIFNFPSFSYFFSTSCYYSKSSLSPTDFNERRWGNLSIGNSWSMPFSCVTLLHRKCRLPGEMAGVSTHGGSHQKVPHLASINH